MKPIFVRPARAEDCELYANWTLSTERNVPDPAVLTYPSSRVRCAFDEEGPLVFMPTQQPLHMESIAVRPGANLRQVAAALNALFHDTVTRAAEAGAGEIYFMATEDTVPELATRHGFEQMPWKVYRVKIKDLEGRYDAQSEARPALCDQQADPGQRGQSHRGSVPRGE